MKKILVTGAAGFIGFHLAKSLCERGYNVVGLDCINSYYDVNLKYGRLAQLGIENTNTLPDSQLILSRLYPNFSFIKEDLANLEGLEKVFKEGDFDIVCNLAAQAGVRYSFENPFSYVHSNINGFINIIELSKRYGIEHFIYASSSSVYGNNAKIPFEETDRVDKPQSIYAATKKANELMAHVYSSQMGLPTTGLRFFTVYGPWGRPDMAPFIFMRSILEGKTIKVFNHGNLSRDFSYIDDIVTGIVKIIEKPVAKKKDDNETVGEGYYKIYNIGNSSPVELMDFIQAIEQVTGKEAVKEFVPMQQGDVFITYANTSSLDADYGFKPCTPLSYGIGEFYKWYKGFYNI